MSGRHLAAAVMVLAMGAPQLFADNAKPRGGGGGGGHSSGGSGHASHGSSGGGGGSSNGYHPSNGGGAPLTGAQARHPRAGTGTGYRYPYYGGGYYGGGYYGGGYYGGYYPYYSPYYYHPYYWGYGAYPWGGLYFDSYWYGGGGPSYGSASYTYTAPGGETGSIRLMVDKAKAKVYVDGVYAGIVDDFDGLFQRLYVSPGRHDITLKLEGYKTERFDVYVQEGSTVKIEHHMAVGSGEERNTEYAPLDRPEYRDDERGQHETRYEARPPEGQGAGQAGSQATGQGILQLNVRPDDASVYVDGSFTGSVREAARLQLPAGRHRVEIVRPGYRTYDHEIDVQTGQSVDLSVELDK